MSAAEGSYYGSKSRSSSREVSPLVEALGSTSWRARQDAVGSLKVNATADSVSDIISVIRDSHRDLSRLNAALQVLAATDVDVVPTLIELLGSPDAEIRSYMAIVLGERMDARSVTPLIDALADPDVNVRVSVIEALGKLRAGKAVDELMVFVDSKDFDTAFPALDALAAIGDERVASRLADLLQDPFLSVPAIDALGQLGNEESIAGLISLLDDRDAPVSAVAGAINRIAVRYAERTGDLDFVPALVRQLVIPTRKARLLSAFSSPVLTGASEVAFILNCLEDEVADEALVRLLEHPQHRTHVVDLLSRRKAPILGTLLRRLSSADSFTQLAIAEICARIGGVAAVPALLQLAESDDDSSVTIALSALSRIGDARLYDVAKQFLGHPSSAVRQAAVVAINSLGAAATAPDMRVLLQSTDPLVRESSVKVATYLGLSECTDLIFACCNDPDEAVRRTALGHLPCLSDARVASCLAVALGSESVQIRAAATRALPEVDDPTAARSLIAKALGDDDVWVRYFAVRAVSTIAPDDNLTQITIRMAIDDPAMQVQIAAVEGLATFGPAAVSTLISMIDGDVPDLVRPAFESLSRIDHPEALSTLLRGLQSEASDIKIAAIRGLANKRQIAIEPLAQVAISASPVLATEAVNAIAKTQCPEAAERIIELAAIPLKRDACMAALTEMGHSAIVPLARGLRVSDLDVRRAIVTVLSLNRSELAREALETALNDPEPAVRHAALSALANRRVTGHSVGTVQR